MPTLHAAGDHRRGTRGPAVLYCTLSAALVVLVADLALTARPPSPPQIAELTPEAQHQITKAPNQLTSSLGSAAGGPGGAGGKGTTTTTLSTVPTAAPSSAPGSPPIVEAAVHHCFGSPPRQISFDTQSPPCVAYWQGNNGGATWQGLTGTSISEVEASGPYPDDARIMGDLQYFINRYFELYGREIRIHVLGALTPADCSQMQAFADGIVQEFRPFAVGSADWNADTCYRVDMARDHVVSTGLQEWIPQSTVDQYSPYLWSYPMSGEGQMTAMGDFVCAQLAGRDARYSPDPAIAAQPRRFGLIFTYDITQYPPSPATLQRRLESCGASLAVVATFDNQGTASTFDQQAVLDMKTNGVTTVICECSYIDDESDIPKYADVERYYPEWIVAKQLHFDFDFKDQWPEPDQRRAVIGLTQEPAQLPYPDTTIDQAIAAVDPGFSVQDGPIDYRLMQREYWELLLIASGIQMAGPDLTPYSFARGLQLARFPNPYSPQMEGLAGFATATYSMTDDSAVEWWNDAAVPPYDDQGTGAWCYVDGGRRFGEAEGDWATPMALFVGSCATSPPGS